MSKVLVTHVLVGAIRSAAQPTHRSPETRVVSVSLEYELMATLVDQIRGDHHCVGKQQGSQQVDCPGGVEKPRKSSHIAAGGVEYGDAVIA